MTHTHTAMTVGRFGWFHMVMFPSLHSYNLNCRETRYVHWMGDSKYPFMPLTYLEITGACFISSIYRASSCPRDIENMECTRIRIYGFLCLELAALLLFICCIILQT